MRVHEQGRAPQRQDKDAWFPQDPLASPLEQAAVVSKIKENRLGWNVAATDHAFENAYWADHALTDRALTGTTMFKNEAANEAASFSAYKNANAVRSVAWANNNEMQNYANSQAMAQDKAMGNIAWMHAEMAKKQHNAQMAASEWAAKNAKFQVEQQLETANKQAIAQAMFADQQAVAGGNATQPAAKAAPALQLLQEDLAAERWASATKPAVEQDKDGWPSLTPNAFPALFPSEAGSFGASLGGPLATEGDALSPWEDAATLTSRGDAMPPLDDMSPVGDPFQARAGVPEMFADLPGNSAEDAAIAAAVREHIADDSALFHRAAAQNMVEKAAYANKAALETAVVRRNAYLSGAGTRSVMWRNLAAQKAVRKRAVWQNEATQKVAQRNAFWTAEAAKKEAARNTYMAGKAAKYNAAENAVAMQNAPAASIALGQSKQDVQISTEGKTELSCVPMDGTHTDILAKVKPCGTYAGICKLPVAEAGKVYPSDTLGKVSQGQHYVVQFDVGLHPNVKGVTLTAIKRDLLGLPKGAGETCLEGIVAGGAHWGNLGMELLGSKDFDSMGKCGQSQNGTYNCMQHHMCAAYKMSKTGLNTQGFCGDPDCGDEAAQTLFQCWTGFRPQDLGGDIGDMPKGNAEGAICGPGNTVKGRWHHRENIELASCKAYEGWDRGQGIPAYKETLGMFLQITPAQITPDEWIPAGELKANQSAPAAPAPMPSPAAIPVPVGYVLQEESIAK